MKMPKAVPPEILRPPVQPPWRKYWPVRFRLSSLDEAGEDVYEMDI